MHQQGNKIPWQCEMFAVRSFAGCPVAKSAVPYSAVSRLCKEFVQVLTMFESTSAVLKILVSSLCCVSFERLYFCCFITVSEDLPSIAELCSVILLTLLTIYINLVEC